MSFDERAGDWDAPERIERAEKIAEAIGQALGGRRTGRLLEYGCGTGLVGLHFREAAQLVLMDSSAAMVERAAAKIGDLPTARALRGDLAAGPVEGIGPFDGVLSSMVLHHVADLPALLGRLRALLAVGGRLVVVDLDRDDGAYHRSDAAFDGLHGFRQEELAGLVEEAGLGAVTSRTVYRGTKVDARGQVPYGLFLLSADA